MKLSMGLLPLLALGVLAGDSVQSPALIARAVNLTEMGVPSACESLCTAPLTTVDDLSAKCDNATQAPCIDVACTNDFLDSLDKCTQCWLDNRGMTTTDANDYTDVLTGFRQTCIQKGYKVGNVSTGNQISTDQTTTAGQTSATDKPSTKGTGSGALALREPGMAATLFLSAVVLAAMSASVL